MVQEDEKAASGENATTFADQDIEEILAHSKVVEHKETQTAEEKDLKVRTHPMPITPSAGASSGLNGWVLAIMAWQDKFGVARFRLANGDDLDPKDPDFWLKVRTIIEGRTAGRLDGGTDLASGWRASVLCS